MTSNGMHSKLKAQMALGRFSVPQIRRKEHNSIMTAFTLKASMWSEFSYEELFSGSQTPGSIAYRNKQKDKVSDKVMEKNEFQVKLADKVADDKDNVKAVVKTKDKGKGTDTIMLGLLGGCSASFPQGLYCFIASSLSEFLATFEDIADRDVMNTAEEGSEDVHCRNYDGLQSRQGLGLLRIIFLAAI
ncbi:hypothetical protein BJV82DRAFT_576884 [Fennellomyces sp. T-0311]|nr:hypothetical protein BJV82DRAFT_576884 [Fennellomyces sp. T-0311]